MTYQAYLIFVLLIITNSRNGYSQSSDVVCVKAIRYSGYIFPESQDYFIPTVFDQKRWNPTKNDIKQTEKVIREYVKENALNKELKWLRLYKRQYVGYVNNSGERLIWVNFICCWRFRKSMKKDTSLSLDGGNCFWSLDVNLDKQEIFGLIINGVS